MGGCSSTSEKKYSQKTSDNGKSEAEATISPDKTAPSKEDLKSISKKDMKTAHLVQKTKSEMKNISKKSESRSLSLQGKSQRKSGSRLRITHDEVLDHCSLEDQE